MGNLLMNYNIMTMPTYQQIHDALSLSHNLISPAELHGMLCGFICTGIKQLDNNNFSDILMLALPDDDTTEVNLILNALFTQTQAQIQQFEMSFRLLLPHDEADLEERAIEFGKWCEGFLTSIHFSKLTNLYRNQDEVNDILLKLNAAAKLQFNNLQYSEEDEYYFMEVTEFVRLSVFAIYHELLSIDDSHIDIYPVNNTPTLH